MTRGIGAVKDNRKCSIIAYKYHIQLYYIIGLETECLKCASPSMMPEETINGLLSDLPTELLVGQHKAFQPYGELHITASHHVLDLEV